MNIKRGNCVSETFENVGVQVVIAMFLGAAAGIPIEGLPLLFALDRIFDMIRMALNITGDAACAVIIDGIVKEKRKVTNLEGSL